MERVSHNSELFYVSGDGALPSLKKIMDRSTYSDEDLNGPAATITMMTNFLEEAVMAADQNENNAAGNGGSDDDKHKISHMISMPKTSNRLSPTSFTNICQGLGLSNQVGSMEIDGDASYATLTPLQPLTTVSDCLPTDRFSTDLLNYPQNMVNPLNEQLLLDFQKVQQQLIANNNADLSALYNQISHGAAPTVPAGKNDFGLGNYDDLLAQKVIYLENDPKATQYANNINDFVAEAGERFGNYGNIQQIAPFLAENLRYLNENFPISDDFKDKQHNLLLNSGPTNLTAMNQGGKSINLLESINSSTYQLLNNSGGSNFTPLNLIDSYQYEKLAALGLNFPYSGISLNNNLGNCPSDLNVQSDDFNLRYQALNSSSISSSADLKTAIEIDHFNYIQHHLQFQNNGTFGGPQNGFQQAHLIHSQQDKDLEANQLLMMANEMDNLPSTQPSNQIVSLEDFIANNHQLLLGNSELAQNAEFNNPYGVGQKLSQETSGPSNVVIHHHGLSSQQLPSINMPTLKKRDTTLNNRTLNKVSSPSLSNAKSISNDGNRYAHHDQMVLQAQLYNNQLATDLQVHPLHSHSPSKAQQQHQQQILNAGVSTVDLVELGMLEQQRRIENNGNEASSLSTTSAKQLAHDQHGNFESDDCKLPNIVVIKNDMLEAMKNNSKKAHLLQNSSSHMISAVGSSDLGGNIFSYGGTSGSPGNTFFNLNLSQHLSIAGLDVAATMPINASSGATAAIEAAILNNAMRSFGQHHHNLPQPLLLESSSLTSSPACSPCSTPTLPPSALVRPNCGSSNDSGSLTTTVKALSTSNGGASTQQASRKSRSHHAKSGGSSKNNRTSKTNVGIVEEDGIVAMSPDDAILDIKPSHARSNHSTSHNGSAVGDELEEINTKDLAQRISSELKRYSIPQAVFAQRVLCRSQGTLSDLLRNPKPWSKLKSGRETFRRMSKWLDEPEFQRMSSLRLAGKMSIKRGPQNSLDTGEGLDTRTNGPPPSANNKLCGGNLLHANNSITITYAPVIVPNTTLSAIGKVDANNLRNKAKKKDDKPCQFLQGQVQQQQPPQQQQQLIQSQVASSESSSNSSNGHKKPRLVFTDIQRRTLQAIFKETKRPSKEMQSTIAQQLGLDLSTVGNFFMNARRRSLDKWRDDRCSSSTGSVCCHSNIADDDDEEGDGIYDNDEDVKLAAAAAELIANDGQLSAYGRHGRDNDSMDDDDEVYTCQINVSSAASHCKRTGAGLHQSNTTASGGGRLTRSRTTAPTHKSASSHRLLHQQPQKMEDYVDYYGDTDCHSGINTDTTQMDDDGLDGVVSSTTIIGAESVTPQEQSQREIDALSVIKLEESTVETLTEVDKMSGVCCHASGAYENRNAGFDLGSVSEITQATMESVHITTTTGPLNDPTSGMGEDDNNSKNIANAIDTTESHHQVSEFNNAAEDHSRLSVIEMTY